MTIVVLFFVEMMVMRYSRFGASHGHDHGHEHDSPSLEETKKTETTPTDVKKHIPGEDHLGHQREHHDIELADKNSSLEEYMAQLTSIFILEFGIIFHSIFIGLTLAVAGAEFPTLYVVLAFHQTFEGLALGSRLAAVAWPTTKRQTPYYLAIGYAVSTPAAIAIGLGARRSFSPGSATALVANGVFDALSAGILIYTGLVELMAHEFMFSGHMQRAPLRVVLAAVGTMVLGAWLMALLGKWA